MKLSFAFLLVLLTACTTAQEPTPFRGFITATPVPATPTSSPTNTITPTATLTPEPTSTSSPTATVSPSPANTPRPTTRPPVIVPPTPSVIDIDLSALLAQDASGTPKDASAFALSFLPDQRILRTVAKLANVPPSTRVKAAWTAIDTYNVSPPNTKLGETEFAAGGMPNLDFGIPMSRGNFLPGKYKIEIWFNGNLDTVLNFSMAVPPDVNVTALEIQPPNPTRGQDVTFVATFLNTTGEPRAYDWLALIFRQNQSKAFGESAHQVIQIPPGQTRFTIADSWRLTGTGDCESFFAQAHFRNADKNRIPFKSFDGEIVSAGFTICPP